MRVPISSVHPRAHRQHSFQQPVRLSLRHTNAEHPFLVCTSDASANDSSGTDVESPSSSTPTWKESTAAAKWSLWLLSTKSYF
jgi:hypothetical protein